MQAVVSFSAEYQIKSHIPPRVQISVNSFKFPSCDYTSQAEYFITLAIEILIEILIVYGVDY